MNNPARALPIAIVAAVIAASSAFAASPPAPPLPPPANAPIQVRIAFPDGSRREITVSEADVRATTRRNIFYDIDAFIETAFRRLDLDYGVECAPAQPERTCTVARIGPHANTTTHHWQLTRDGHADRYGINQVNWYGVHTLEFNYLAKRKQK
jgi:hypothetical protein